MPFCVKCGAFNDGNSKFCTNCGFSMNGEIGIDEEEKQTAENQNLISETAYTQKDEGVQEMPVQTNPFAQPAIAPAVNTTVVKSQNIQYSPQTGYRIIGDDSFKKKTTQNYGSNPAKAGFVLGLIGLIFSFPMLAVKAAQTVGSGQLYPSVFGIFILFFLSDMLIPVAIAGIILSSVGKKRSTEAKYKKLAKTGFAFSLSSLIMLVLFVFLNWIF